MALENTSQRKPEPELLLPEPSTGVIDDNTQGGSTSEPSESTKLCLRNTEARWIRFFTRFTREDFQPAGIINYLKWRLESRRRHQLRTITVRHWWWELTRLYLHRFKVTMPPETRAYVLSRLDRGLVTPLNLNTRMTATSYRTAICEKKPKLGGEPTITRGPTVKKELPVRREAIVKREISEAVIKREPLADD